MYFGGISGFNAFYPRDVHPNQHVPPIVLTQFLKFNQPVVLDTPVWQMRGVNLTHKDSVIAFEFAALDYSAPHKNQYMYKLEGFDDDWVDHGTRRRVTYTNLASGQYNFRVRASNNDGVWNEEGLTIGINIQPPPWRSWWAYFLDAFALCCAVLAFLRFQAIRRQRADALERANTELRSRSKKGSATKGNSRRRRRKRRPISM